MMQPTFLARLPQRLLEGDERRLISPAPTIMVTSSSTVMGEWRAIILRGKKPEGLRNSARARLVSIGPIRHLHRSGFEVVSLTAFTLSRALHLPAGSMCPTGITKTARRSSSGVTVTMTTMRFGKNSFVRASELLQFCLASRVFHRLARFRTSRSSIQCLPYYSKHVT